MFNFYSTLYLSLYHVYTHNYNNNCLARCSYYTTRSLQQWFLSHIVSHSASHKADWILTTCLALLYAPVLNVMKVLEVGRSDFRLLQRSFATAFSVCVFCSRSLLCVRLRLSVFLMLFLLLNSHLLILQVVIKTNK